MVHVMAAAAGLSLILAKSAVAFAAVKYAGAAYLCFLGIRMILDSRSDVLPSASFAHRNRLPRLSARAGNSLGQGVATEVLNPKTALFFLSFIPQFVDHSQAHLFGPFLLLGTISVMLNTSADVLVVLLAGPLGQRIRESARFRRRQRATTGWVMIGLATYLAWGESK